MKKNHYCFIVAVVFTLSIFEVKAQTEENKSSFNLEECIEYALKNSASINDATIDAKIAKAKVGEIRSTGLPQINGNVEVSHNNPLRRMFFPPGVAGNFLGEVGALLPPGAVVAVPNLFQLKNSADAGVSINQLLFSGSYIVGLQAAKTYQELASKTVTQSRIQTVEQVTKAYYTVLINRERLNLFEGNIARVDSLLRNTKGMYESGFAEKIDLDRIQVTLNNLVIEREKFKDLEKLSNLLLKYQMNYPMNQDMIILGDVRDLNIETMSYDTLINNFDYSRRIEYSILQTQEALQRLDIKNENAAYLPSLSAFANLGYFTQSPTLDGLFKTESNLPNIPELSQIGPDKWYGYGLFGVTLKVPIFDGLGRSYRVQQSKLALKKVENGFTTLRNNIDLQVNQSKINLGNNLKTLKAQEDNVK
ncbi:MAG: TolC family protein, partial [Bacteroidota bacterium]|nr:TolC family protein [Bacteroidota bacterium]